MRTRVLHGKEKFVINKKSKSSAQSSLLPQGDLVPQKGVVVGEPVEIQSCIQDLKKNISKIESAYSRLSFLLKELQSLKNK